MKIELVDDTRLYITLVPSDLKDLNLTFEELSWNDTHSKKVIEDLLKLAAWKTGFKTTGHNLLIEAIPEFLGGCMLKFTLLPAKTKSTRKKYRIKEPEGPYIYEFENAENVLRAIELLAQNKEPRGKSRLLLNGSAYTLILYPPKKLPERADALLSEYGHFNGRGKSAAAAALEHGRLLADNNAVDSIARYLA